MEGRGKIQKTDTSSHLNVAARVNHFALTDVSRNAGKKRKGKKQLKGIEKGRTEGAVSLRSKDDGGDFRKKVGQKSCPL